MDKTASVIAALNAGKLPTQEQINEFIDRLTNSSALSKDPNLSGELSAQGKVLQDDIYSLLLTYKQLGEHKNADNAVQEALWHLSEADISSTSLDVDVSKEQAAQDARAVSRSIRTIARILWENFSHEGGALGHDFASFLRLALADVADYVGQTAGSTAESLRNLDAQVEQGERNELGLKKRKAEDEAEDTDIRVKFEKTMDATKETGSKAIGAGQAATAKAQELADRTSNRLQDAFNKICDRAQDDPEYHKSISTIFDLAQKWVDKTLDASGNVNQATDLEAFLDDPTPEKHLINAIRSLRAVIERLAGGKSLDDVFAKLRLCGVDIQQDDDLRAWFNELITHLRRSLDERGYVRSEEAEKKRHYLKKQWKELLDADSDKGRKWKKDVAAFRDELKSFNAALDDDKDLKKLRKAHAKLTGDIEDTLLTAGSQGLQSLMEKAPWFWQDMFNVYLPRVMDVLKEIPIPRTEYKDSSVEFVLEDLDISSFSLLPGHAYIRNITDIDIKAPSASSKDIDTSVGSLTRVYIQALQLQLREVSFYYLDKTATVGPSEYTGLLEFTLPPQGIDVDIVVRTIPNSPEGLKQRQRKGGFLEIQRVEVKVSEDIELSVKESNHTVLVTVFKSMMLSRFREALQTVLEQQLHGALEWIDAIAWDVGRRMEVFADAGLGHGASLVAGVWSELGHLRTTDGGLLSNWKATGTGILKEDAHSKFAMGAEPQVLSGEKRGPKGTFSEPITDRMDIDVDVNGNVDGAKAVAEQAKEQVKKGYKKVKSFKDTVDAKVEEERSRTGWQSPAFGVV